MFAWVVLLFVTAVQDAEPVTLVWVLGSLAFWVTAFWFVAGSWLRRRLPPEDGPEAGRRGA